MPGEHPLDVTVAYLRFPLRAEHRGGLCDGSLCPRCESTRIQKWGRFAGRQRFRCRDCRRTFSTFTGTPLRYLKRPERWRSFLWCMEGRLTVRRTGSILRIHRNTALRWRHRVLDHWRGEPHRRLRGSIAVGEFWLPLNEKGSRRMGRPPRRHGGAPARNSPHLERVPLVVAVEADGVGAYDFSMERIVGPSALRSDYERFLATRLGAVEELVSWRRPRWSLAGVARSVGAAYRRDQRSPREWSVVRLQRELRRWLRPLYGVATHRLDNYLEWFRRDRPMPLPRPP